MILRNYLVKVYRIYPVGIAIKRCILILLLLTFIHLPTHSLAKNNPTKTETQALLNYEDKIGFQENKGQMVDKNKQPVPFVLFKAEAPGLNIWVTTKGLTYQFFTVNKEFLTDNNGNAILDNFGKKKKKKTTHWHRVDMTLKGGTIKKENIITKGEIAQRNKNYYLGHCPDGIFNVKTFSRIRINQVYPGIDWVLYSTKNGKLKHDFIVHPEADPNVIKLIYEGSGSIDVTDNRIQFSNEIGKMIEGNLLCYQYDASREITSSYSIQKNNLLLNLGAGMDEKNSRKSTSPNSSLFSVEVGLKIDTYDKNKELIVDPKLAWGTLFGGNLEDGIMDIRADSKGNLFVTGYANSTDFPFQDANTYIDSTVIVTDIFILKFNNDGQLLWATYYGGDDYETANSMAIDKNDNIWVIGNTYSPNFPVTTGAFQSTLNASIPGAKDLIILNFDNNGNRLLSTYYGGTDDDNGYDITVDLYENIWITGGTKSTNFPISDGAPQKTNAGEQDIFLIKMTKNGSRQLATYYGGNDSEEGHGITADASGNIWITGRSESDNLTTPNAFQTSKNMELDAIVVKFDNDGNLLYSTYYGGESFDSGIDITSDSNGDIWIIGNTGSSDLSLTPNTFQDKFGGELDIFILKFNSQGARLWATYYGGSEEDITYCYNNIAIGECDDVFISFNTESNDMQTKDLGECSFYDSTNNQSSLDCFVGQFDLSGNLIWSTYFGGALADFKAPLTLDKDNNLFVGGEFVSYEYNDPSELPLLNPGSNAYFDDTPNGGDDSFILKFTPLNDFSQQQTDPSSCNACDGTATVKIHCGLPPYSYEWNNGNKKVNTTDTSYTITDLCPGDYNVIVTTAGCTPKGNTLYFPMLNDCVVPESVFIPNSFTPNNDGLNDFFYPVGNSITNKDYVFKVFNRWGQVIFESASPLKRWDGTDNGKILPQGIYTWQFQFEDINGKKKMDIGRVALIP